MHRLPKNLVSYLNKCTSVYVETGRYCNPAIPKEIDFVSIAKQVFKMKHNFYLIVLFINMSGKKYSKLFDFNILTYLLYPHSLISTKLTRLYIRD